MKFLNSLDILGSGGTLLDVQGSQGQLFSVTDSLSGSIFAVSDISGVPILDVNSSGTSYFSGNVGIGTTIPIAKLSVLATSTGYSSDSQIKVSDGSTSYYGGLSFDDAGSTRLSVRNSYDGTGAVVGFGFGGSSDKVQIINGTGFIVNEGNVGIGTTSPDSNLEISQNTGATIRLTSSDNFAAAGEVVGSIDFVSKDYNYTSQPIKAQIQAVINSSVGNSDLIINTTLNANKLERMRITSAGAIQFNSYGAGTLVTDASGNITVSSGGGAGGPYLPLAGGTLSGSVIQNGGNIDFSDGRSANFGNGDDLQIFHNGSNSHIETSSTSVGDFFVTARGTNHDLYLEATDNIYIRPQGNENGVVVVGNGGVTLYHNNVAKLETTSTGVTVTGSAGISIQGTNATGAESILVQGFASTDTLGSIRTANNGGYSQNMRFYTSDIAGQPENLTLTLTSAQNAVFAAGVEALTVSALTVTANTFLGDLNGTINTVTTAVTKANATNDTTVATTAFVQNLIGTIPAGLVFQGTWNAATNTPTLTSGSGTTGNFYIVSTSGSTNLDGVTDWVTGDWAVFIEQGGTDAWEKIDNSSVLDGAGTGQTLPLWSGSGTSNTLTDSKLVQNTAGTLITAFANSAGNTGTFITNSEGGGEIGLTVQSRTNRAKLRVADNDSNAYVVAEAGKAFYGTSASGDATNITVLTSGNVGIKKTTPETNLHIYDTVDADPPLPGFANTGMFALDHANQATLSIGVNSSNTYWISNVNRSFTGPNYYNISLNPLGGNVGIGTTSPSRKLHIVSGATNALSLDSTEQYMMEFAKAGVSKYWFKVTSTDSFQLHKNGTGDFVTVSSTGNVGINETNPGVKLQVITPDEQVTNFSSSVVDQLIYSQISANSSTAGVITGAAALELVGKANGSGHGRHAWIGAEGTSNTTFETKIKFKIRGETASGYDWTGSTEAPTIMTLEGSGNVGIGTTSPSQKLEVNGVARAEAVNVYGAGDASSTSPQIYSPSTGAFAISGNGGEKMRIESDGIISIGEGATQSWIANKVQTTTTAVLGKQSMSDIDRTTANWMRITNPVYSTNGSVGLIMRTFPNSDARQGAGIIASGGSDNAATDLDLFVSQQTSGATTSTSYSALSIKGNTGNVGIGTTAPGAPLDVEGGALGNTSGDSTTAAIIRAGRQNIIFKDTRTADGTDWKDATFKIIAAIDSTSHQSIDFVNDGAYQEHIDLRVGNQVFSTRFASNGNVGVGTTSPAAKLQVSGSVQLDVMPTNESEGSIKIGRYDANTSRYNLVKNFVSATAASNYMRFAVHNGTENATVDVMSLNGAGNVGIGTTSPGTQKLYVDGGETTLNRGNTDGAIATFRGKNNVQAVIGTLMSYFTGNVGIGMTNPGVRLDIDGGDGGASVRVKGDQPAGTYYYGYMYDGTNLKGTTQTNIFHSGSTIAANTTIAEYAGLRIDAPSVAATGAVITNNYGIYQSGSAQKNYFNGNVGIGTTDPSEKLHVSGNLRVTGAFADSSASVGSAGTVLSSTNTGTAWVGASGLPGGPYLPLTGGTLTGDLIIESALLSNQENTNVDTGAETVASVLKATYTAAFFDFVIKEGTNLRAGTVFACHDGTNVVYTETSTNDLGDTSDVTLSVDISGTAMRLRATVTSDDWIIKSLIRAI